MAHSQGWNQIWDWDFSTLDSRVELCSQEEDILREQCAAAYPTRKVLLVVKQYAKSSIKIQKLIEILIIENFQKICIFSV